MCYPRQISYKSWSQVLDSFSCKFVKSKKNIIHLGECFVYIKYIKDTITSYHFLNHQQPAAIWGICCCKMLMNLPGLVNKQTRNEVFHNEMLFLKTHTTMFHLHFCIKARSFLDSSCLKRTQRCGHESLSSCQGTSGFTLILLIGGSFVNSKTRWVMFQRGRGSR